MPIIDMSEMSPPVLCPLCVHVTLAMLTGWMVAKVRGAQHGIHPLAFLLLRYYWIWKCVTCACIRLCWIKLLYRFEICPRCSWTHIWSCCGRDSRMLTLRALIHGNNFTGAGYATIMQLKSVEKVSPWWGLHLLNAFEAWLVEHFLQTVTGVEWDCL